MAKKKSKDKAGSNTIAMNKQARHEYFIDDEIEAGIELQGWEVKSLRSGKVNKITKNNPAPIPAKPKALMGKYAGGNGTGGNNQDSYNAVKDQGIAGGKGDQGVTNGSIDSKAYTGSGGPFVTKGDRRVTKTYSFNGDVPPATIYAEIEVNPNGVGRFIQISRGSSSNDSKYKRAIVEYLTKINFNSADHSSIVTVKFKFDLQ